MRHFESLSLRTPQTVPPTPGTVLQNKIESKLEKSLCNKFHIQLQQQMGVFPASILEAMKSLREEMQSMKKDAKAEVDKTSASTSKAVLRVDNKSVEVQTKTCSSVFVRGLRIPSRFSPCETHSREMAQTSGFDPTTEVKTCFDCKMFDIANWVACLNGENGPGGTPSRDSFSFTSRSTGDFLSHQTASFLRQKPFKHTQSGGRIPKT